MSRTAGCDGYHVFMLHVMRGEMRFSKTRLVKRDRDSQGG